MEVDFGSNESLAEPFFWCRVGFLPLDTLENMIFYDLLIPLMSFGLGCLKHPAERLKRLRIWCGIEFTIRVLGAGAEFFNLRNFFELVFAPGAANER